MFLIAGISNSNNNSLVLAENPVTGGPIPPTPPICNEQPNHYGQCGGTCNGQTFDSQEEIDVTKIVDSNCNVSWVCTNKGKSATCGFNPPSAPPAPPVFQPRCTQACDGQTLCGQGQSVISLFANNEAGWVSQHNSEVNNCQAAPVTPVAPAAPAAPAQPAANVSCFVCDNTGFADGQGRWRLGGNCGSGLPACQANNSSTFGGCTGATEGAICETVAIPTPAPTPAPSAAPITNNNCTGGSCNSQGGNASATGGSSTVTVTTPAAQPAQVVLAQVAQPGNVGVATPVQVAGTTATVLPKTGLPALAWAAAAFLPAGFRIKRFGKGIKSDNSNPNYLWESREFKRI